MVGDQAARSLRSLEQLRFDNSALARLPIDPLLRDGVSPHPISARDETADTLLCTTPRHRVPGACYSLARASPVAHPRLVAASQDALDLLQLAPTEATRPEFVDYFCGAAVLPGARPAAHNYAGHQFGHFAGQLGDGACLYLGEVLVGGEDEQDTAPQNVARWELQLKGAGRTPYSRNGDGRKVLASCIREFLACEAMHYLGLPTVRAAACFSSSTGAVRDTFYTGDNVEQCCGILLRLAPSFLRVGSFEIFRSPDPLTAQAGPSAGLELELVELGLPDPTAKPKRAQAGTKDKFLPALVKFAVSQCFPEVEASVEQQLTDEGLVPDDAATSARASQLLGLGLLRQVVVRTARLVAGWEAVGFCHGLLNTDNMSLLGLTLDYGPFEFMGCYDPELCPNVADDAGRYRFAAQREVCKWNMYKLAEALAPVLPPAEGEAIVAHEFDLEFDKEWLLLFRQKLGLQRIVDLRASRRKSELAGDTDAVEAADVAIEQMAVTDEADATLIRELLHVMHRTGADYTLTFKALERIDDLRSNACIAGFLDALCPTLASPAQLAAQAHTQSRMPPEQVHSLILLCQDQPALLHHLGIPAAALVREVDRLLDPPPSTLSARSQWEAWAKTYWYRLLKELPKDDDEAGTAPGARKGSETDPAQGAGPAATATAASKQSKQSKQGTHEEDRRAAAAFARATRLRLRVMRRRNPHTVLRRHMLDQAASLAQVHQDFGEVTRLLHLLSDPFSSDLEISLGFGFERSSADALKPKPADITMTWLNYRLLPPRETLTLHLPGFVLLGAHHPGSDAQPVTLALQGACLAPTPPHRRPRPRVLPQPPHSIFRGALLASAPPSPHRGQQMASRQALASRDPHNLNSQTQTHMHPSPEPCVCYGSTP